MLLAEMPVAVVMQRRAVNHPWCDESWSAVAVLPGHVDPQDIALPPPTAQCHHELVPGLRLELHPDEDEAYFENWAAPEPKVFVMWQWRDGRATPVLASVSYAEGTRMLDSGDGACGVPMAREIHEWLGAYLQQHYRPQPRGRHHG